MEISAGVVRANEAEIMTVFHNPRRFRLIRPYLTMENLPGKKTTPGRMEFCLVFGKNWK